MSLFGGEDTVDEPPLSPTNDLQASEVFTSSAAPSSVDSFEAAQNEDPTLYDTIDTGDEDGSLENSEEELRPDEELSRPNRFTGHPSTWKRYTEADRQVATSLDQIQSGDLSAHLYNAHALKRRARLPQAQLDNVNIWRGKDSWLKKGEELEYSDILGNVQTELVPPKRWTAWPLPVKEVPGPNEKFWSRRGVDEALAFTARGAGSELRGEVLAVFLRLAKEKWMGRRTGQDSQTREDETDRHSRKNSRARSKSATSQRSQTSASDFDPDAADLEDSDSDMGSSGEEFATPNNSKQHLGNTPIPKKRGRKAVPPSVKAAFLADDDRAEDLLRPTINSMLSQIDGLAAGIRRTRMNHFGQGAYSDTSGSEALSDAGSFRSRSRQRSTSRARGAIGKKRTSKQPTKRKRKAIPLDDDDSASDFGAETGLDNQSTSSSSETSTLRGRRARSKSAAGESSPSTERKAFEQAGLLDWSEVLGIASVLGWDERAIARTAQRCASLFGEGMAFRSLDEDAAPHRSREPVHFTPSTIPAPDVLGITPPANPKRPFFDTGTLRCPHPDCRAHKEDFKIPYRVVEHVKRVHGYDPRTNDSDNEERKVGGVHVDGFLQPITLKQGWMGRGRSKSKSREPVQKRRRRVKAQSESEAANENEAENEVSSPEAAVQDSA